jgi:hypothetical protein
MLTDGRARGRSDADYSITQRLGSLLFFEMNAYDIDTRIAIFVMRRTTPEPLPGVEFIHFVERLYDSTMKTPHRHFEESEAPAKHD